MIEKSIPKIMSIEISNEAQLFDVLANPEKYRNLTNVKFSAEFINSIQFRLKIEGVTLDNIPINGHTTIDLLNICNAWQNAINTIYANVAKGRDDARGRGLSKEEREKLTLVFKIQNGSTEEIVENLPNIINSFSNMLPEVQLTLIGAVCIIAGGFIYYLVKKDDNDKRKFLAHNATVDNALMMVERVTIEALNSPKLRIDRAVIGKTELNKQQMQEAYDNMNNEESDIEESVNATFVVTKLYHQGNKKMATLTNANFPKIDCGFAKDLFENNEALFLNSFAKGINIDCEVYIVKTNNGVITKATLLKLLINSPA